MFSTHPKHAAMPQIALLFFCLLLPAVLTAAGWVTSGAATSIHALPNGVELQTGTTPSDTIRLRITALTPEIVRLRYTRQAEFPQDFSYAVDASANFSAPAVALKDTNSLVEFATGSLTVRVYKSNLRVTILDKNGNVLSQDDADYPVAWNGAAFRVTKSLPAGEHYFGLGDKSGPLDHLGQSFVLWNTDAYMWNGSTDPLYKSIPFYLALRNGHAFGLFLDNSYRSSFDFGKESSARSSFGAEGGELNYYVFAGPTPRAVIEQYTSLTGRTPLPPLYALGYQQSRYSYYPESRVREIASNLRSRKIPADVIYLDIDYEQNHRSFTVDPERFPHFKQTVADLAAQNFKVVAIVDLHLQKLPGYKPYDDGLAGNHFVKNPDGSVFSGPVWPGVCVFPEFSRKASREWFASLYSFYLDLGVRGIWNDMNEPAVWQDGKTMPLDTVHRIEEPGYSRITDHREMHNLIGMLNVKSTYEGLLQLHPNERPFVLTRAAFAGTQRYAATWTGDNSATWEHYRLTLPTLLSLGLSGYTMAGNDVGGFALAPSPELDTRWMELGAFEPIFRNHTSTGMPDKEPWVFGPMHEAIQRRYIETRYRLLPYLYTAYEESSRDGLPVMRPLFVDFPIDPAALEDSVFLFGGNLLVAPKPDETPLPYQVILPAGSWYDFWSDKALTNKPIAGGLTLTLNPTLDTLPVFVRGGAILPLQPLVQSTAEVPQGPLELRVYPGPDCHGSVYADDGISFAYKEGHFYRENFTCETTATGVTLHLDTPTGSFTPWWKSLHITFEAAPLPTSAHGDTIPLLVKSSATVTDSRGSHTVVATFDSITGSYNVDIKTPAAGEALTIELRY